MGKTQLWRRLFDEPFDPAEPSTHGIQIAGGPVQLAPSGEPVTLTAWDFGGQDLYHGTHALFLTSRSVFVVVWSPDFETGEEIDPQSGLAFPNRPLAYWLSYVKAVAGTDVAVICVQSRCDGPADARPMPASTRSLQGSPAPRLSKRGA